MPTTPDPLPLRGDVAEEIGRANLFSGELIALHRVSGQGRSAAPETFETFLWGLKAGKNEVIADLMGNWTRQSEAANRQRVQARIDSAASYSGVQIVGQDVVGPDHVLLRVDFVKTDSSVVREVFMMKRINGKWYCL